MQVFLEKLAHALRAQHPEGLSGVAVVLPGRRAGPVLRRYLAQAHGTVQWSPDMLVMGGLMQRLADMRQGASIELLGLLHQVHQQVAGANAGSFADLLQWGPTTLRDMSDVDHHLLALDDFYRELEQMDDIDAWSFRLGDLSEGQRRAVTHWRHTALLHRAMHERMRATSMGTAGMVARTAVERFGQAPLPWKAVWFAGLHTLTPAAQTIMRQLLDQGLAYIAWDADRYYLDDPDQEAGLTLRRHIKEFGPGVIPPVNEIRERRREVFSIAVPNDPAQAIHVAGQLHARAVDAARSTNVVLADTALLLPLLQVMPPTIGAVHVTMGVPLTALPVHSFLGAFLQLHLAHRTSTGFPIKDLVDLLAHPFARRNGDDAALLTVLRAEQRPHVTLERLNTWITMHQWTDLHGLTEALAPATDVLAEVPARIRSLIAWARARHAHDPWAGEQLYHMANAQLRLDHVLEQAALPPLDLRTYIALRRRSLQEETLDLTSDAGHGVQITDMAEAHTEGRPYTIVMSANEGRLPPTEPPQSWIPHEVRRHHGLPMMEEQVAGSAYQMMRLLQQSDRLDLVHTTDADRSGPTRFLTQWVHELVDQSATLIEYSVRTAPMPARAPAQVEVHKHGSVTDLLDALFKRGLSPTALGTYLRCSLDFFHSYVLGLRERDLADERLGSDVLGQLVHGTLEDLYRPWIGTVLKPGMLKDARILVEERLRSRAARNWPVELIGQGHYRLRLDMAARAIERYLRLEADRCRTIPVMPLHIELDVRAVLPDGVALYGRCDRVELRDGVHHILDMKTGRVESEQLQMKSLDRSALLPKHSFGLQLLVYAWAYLQQHPDVPVVRAALVPLRQQTGHEQAVLELAGSVDITQGQVPDITRLLTRLVEEVRDPARPFTHDPRSPPCRACAVAG